MTLKIEFELNQLNVSLDLSQARALVCKSFQVWLKSLSDNNVYLINDIIQFVDDTNYFVNDTIYLTEDSLKKSLAILNKLELSHLIV